ncbi:DNA adenine methylase [Croceicoccus naphthovorans]|uniref:site-specific DNA-methyltransferase (adenine-specific) n=1 Tax=Croceicoccus naphthovorans TaxID=1348774 RepID=A0A0G3XHL1_9SPHN|nr:DNA adenine methylase [Croceicoccus naphthovorans]AKM09893.1 DNA methyltransferase [Croceicoccus naphthovorans]MBB3991357.1 DNA adenine methylase [Croceicoccus naphthovorans]
MELLPERCNPVRPAAPYIGGKKNLAKRLARMIDAHPCGTYAEPFVGMGGVFLRRTRRAEAEIINDISEDVATFFRILQRHYIAFMDMLRFQLTTRSGFERLLKVDPSTLTDLERAARFLYLQRLAFGGKVSGRSFGVMVERPARFDVTKLASQLEELHERLASVVIERLPFAEFIARYDSAGTLFYLDPPYFGSETDYGKDVFSRDDFAVLADRLASIEGRFILSINDAPQVREIFAAFPFDVVETTYTISQGDAQKVGELIIRSPDG